MPILEVFPNPTVKQVIFQITFPNLFYIESKIGDLQMKIMDKFPESSMVLQHQVMFAVGDENKIDDIRQNTPQEQVGKIWKFDNQSLGYQLQVQGNSLSITSSFHKTYNNQNSVNRFRDIIEAVLKPFLDLTHLPTVNRIGLRYIDECPFKEKTTKTFRAHFKSCFSTTRFSIEESVEHQYAVLVKRGEYSMRYVEQYNFNNNPSLLILDFDASANNIASDKCLEITDQLHDLIANEYELTIKKPVYAYMRKIKK